MPTIRVLPDRVANQIAAGEVVERPAAVVKELIENSLDAGANRIEVEFRLAGRALLRVEDDGRGMDREDALLALQRHATSKIASAADLDRLATFGFRGEALPSIASVSEFVLRTRRPGDLVGTEVEVRGGRGGEVRECGRPPGTEVVVANLFCSVPARRKFLRSDATEAAHIVQAVRAYALAFPEKAFVLVEDGRERLRTAPCPTRRDRVAEIHGAAYLEDLQPFEAAEGAWQLQGFIGRPGVARATRSEIQCFVNRRPVDSRTLAYGLIEACQGRVPPGRFPVGLLFLEIDPAAVDVNVHPTKREVRFREEGRVRGLVIRSVLTALDGAGASPAPGPALAPSGTALAPAWGPAPVAAPGSGFGRAWPAGRVGASPAWAGSASPPAPPGSGPAGGSAGPAAPQGVARWRWLGSLHGVWIAFETDAGLALLDYRAADERIWYERLLAAYAAAAVERQRLLFPLPVQLDAVAAALLHDHLVFLAAHGWEVAPFGREVFRIEEVPTWLDPEEAEPLLRDIVGLLRAGEVSIHRLEPSRAALARLAAGRAARSAPPASAEAAAQLASALFACQEPLHAPGGRPTLVELTQGELHRRFGRG